MAPDRDSCSSEYGPVKNSVDKINKSVSKCTEQLPKEPLYTNTLSSEYSI